MRIIEKKFFSLFIKIRRHYLIVFTYKIFPQTINKFHFIELKFRNESETRQVT